jgi:fructose-1,6-bisphosphatase/inositol monophosphatase family enzyme
MDAYLESGLRLWDIAAGGLIIECAGGRFIATPLAAPYTYEINASNGVLPVAIV